jgi:hypothetical protein
MATLVIRHHNHRGIRSWLSACKDQWKKSSMKELILNWSWNLSVVRMFHNWRRIFWTFLPHFPCINWNPYRSDFWAIPRIPQKHKASSLMKDSNLGTVATWAKCSNRTNTILPGSACSLSCIRGHSSLCFGKFSAERKRNTFLKVRIEKIIIWWELI